LEPGSVLQGTLACERHTGGVNSLARAALLLLPTPLLAQGVAPEQPPATPQEPAPQAPAAPPPRTEPPADSFAAWWQGSAGPVKLNISFDLLTAIGTSTARDETLLELKGGEHDPRKRGLTLQQAELQINGEVDRFLTGQGVFVTFLEPDSGETVFELEEAWLQTQEMPYHLQFRAGHYFTEFGRVNPLHPHAWDWTDQPVILSRIFGPEGMRAPGARISWLAPTHQYLEFFTGVQNANGPTMTSFRSSDEGFEERGIGGRSFDDTQRTRSLGDMVWTGRVATTFDLAAERRFGIGASALAGPNATGAGASTLVYGVDLAYQWRPADYVPGKPFFRVQAEFLWRDYETAEQVDDSDPLNPVTLPASTLDDYGGYVYALYGWTDHWAAGVRVDWASGKGASYLGGGEFGRASDPFRTDRLRLSPLLQYQASPTSRVRLQYDYDDSDHLANPQHSIWLGFEIMLGAQPASQIGRDGLSGCGCR
jgi:hypothetical protein